MLGAAMLVSACATDTPIPGPVPDVGFQHLTPIRLNVSTVKVTNAYQSPLKAPNAEHRFPTPPSQALQAWARSRLQAVGGPANGAVVEFIVEEASVIETPLKKTEGLKGLFTYEPTARYDATAVAHVTVKNGENGASGETRVTATRSVEVSENATLAQREHAWFTMIEALMDDFNTQMEKQINGYLARWLETPGLK